MSQYLNILVAYPYMSKSVIKILKDIHDELGNNFRFLLDSGAFTAYSSGKEIKLDDYCKFLDNLPFKPWNYFALDVIGNPEETMRNYEIMLSRGYKPAPVFTFGDDLSVIDEYYKTSDFIGIGGLVGRPSNEMLIGLDKILKKVNGRKAHLLGFTRVEYLKLLKPYSCDSSSWNGGARFGHSDLYLGGGKFKKITKKDFLKHPSKEIINAVKRNNGDYKMLSKRQSWHGENESFQLSANSWANFSIDCERSINTKVFIAIAVGNQIKMVHKGYKNATR